MTLKLILFALFSVVCTSGGEMSLANVTRLATGDLFSLVDTDCGPTRCMEVSHGTALGALGDGCVCRCRRDTPTFREDQRVCVNHIDECLMATFGRGSAKPQIPFVFLPLKGQIIYPAKEIIFTDVENAVCVVTSAQYLSTSGWVTLRDLIDNDVPFGLYRDEGSTFLQWRGSAGLHSRLEGRLVAVHVLCSDSSNSQLASSCAAFRVSGASHTAVLDVRSIPFNAGEIVTSESTNQSQGLSVLEALAIGVCVLLLIFVYAAGIIFYIHYKQRQKRKQKDPENNMSSNSSENGSTIESRLDMSNVTMKTNPLLKLGGMDNDFMHDSGMSDSERNNSTLDSNSSSQNIRGNQFQKLNSNVISAMVHSRKKKPSRPSLRQSSPNNLNERLQKRSPSPDFERAPHSDLSIVDCSLENHNMASKQLPASEGEPLIRKKLYFNPLFFETEHLKDPPPAAIEFLIKIREVMSIAKEKMTAKRFIPMLSDIPEEDFYHAVDLGWDIPCARRGRRFSTISLKHENSRKSVHCGGCPGCHNKGGSQKAEALTRSNSCKSCVNDDYKQRIVRKWLDEVPIPPLAQKPKVVAKVSGAQRIDVITPKEQENTPVKAVDHIIKKEESKRLKVVESIPKKVQKIIESKDIIVRTNDEPETVNNKVTDQTEFKKTRPIITLITQPEKKLPSSHASRKIRKKLPPPPPPPPVKPSVSEVKDEDKDKEEPIPAEVKVKMEAVIKELNTCRRVEPTELEEIKLEMIAPIEAAPKLVIPVVAADSQYHSDDNMLTNPRRKLSPPRGDIMEFDSLERTLMRRRRFSLACGPELTNISNYGYERKLEQNRLTSSWLDMKKAVENDLPRQRFLELGNVNNSVSEIVISSPEPLYDNILNHGPLTIQVRGSPVESRRKLYEEFDPDTLDRKPKHADKKRVEKILLKSAGSFKYKSTSSESESPMVPEINCNKNMIGNLRQIYESKAKAQEEDKLMYKRRGSLQYAGQDLTDFMRALKAPDLIRHIEGREKEPKPPVAPKLRRGSELSPKFTSSMRDTPSGERRRALEERFSAYSRAENLNARRSGRRSARTRSRRTDIRKLYRTEDSGYMSTDSNESKRRARYYLQLKPKHLLPDISPMPSRTVNKTPIAIESDTDDLESLCDGRSESGGESIETDSVFFGNFDDSKELLAELGINNYGRDGNIMQHDQIDSGFVGETNIILSGDSDSEHRSVISIMTGKTSATAIKKINNSPYMNTIEC